jgi:hypothetical protein
VAGLLRPDHRANPDREPDVGTEDEARDQELDACDQRYYQSGEDIAGELFGFIGDHKRSIRL